MDLVPGFCHLLDLKDSLWSRCRLALSPCVAKEECNPAVAEVKQVEACHSLCEVMVRNTAAASALRLELIYIAYSHAIDCSVSVCELVLIF